MSQLGLFDLLHAPPVIRPVDPDGAVVREPDVVLSLPHPRMAWNYADIELHQHDDGLWMWATSYCSDGAGGGYRVGAKWGHFAETRDDALYYAIAELKERLARRPCADASKILTWLEGLA